MRHRFTLLSVMLTVASSGAGCASQHGTATTATGAATITHPVVTPLLTQMLPDGAGRQVRMMTVAYAPGQRSAPHRHPGAIYAYVLEGEVLCGLDDAPVLRYRAGECWSERPGQLHAVSANASDTRPAKLLVFFLTDEGKPVLEPAP
jgi:quercetin dioxygenase-like cupin family protein